jgi:hypothetical protein
MMLFAKLRRSVAMFICPELGPQPARAGYNGTAKPMERAALDAAYAERVRAASSKAVAAMAVCEAEQTLYPKGSAAALMATPLTPSEIAGYGRFKRAKEILQITRGVDLHGLVGGPDLDLDHLADRLAILLWGEA